MPENQDISENGYYLNIKDSYNPIHRTTWARRTAGMLAGATLFFIYGFGSGVLASFVPYILKALGVPGAEAIPENLPSVGDIGSCGVLFGVTGAGIGTAITAEVASNAASSAVGVDEIDRRRLEHEKVRDLQKKPAEEVCIDCAVEEAIVKEGVKRETNDEKGPPLFSWKVAAVIAPLFAAFGALIALNTYTSSTVFQHAAGFTGLTTAAEPFTAASIIASASVFGIFGSFLGMKSSLLTNKLSNFYYDVVTERIFNKEPEQQVSIEPKAEIAKAVESLAQKIEEEQTPTPKKFASEKLRFSLEHLLDKSDERVAQNTLPGR